MSSFFCSFVNSGAKDVTSNGYSLKSAVAIASWTETTEQTQPAALRASRFPSLFLSDCLYY